jgi:hypothetical protein
MHFTNTEVELENIPEAENIELTPVHPDLLTIFRMEWLITFLDFNCNYNSITYLCTNARQY